MRTIPTPESCGVADENRLSRDDETTTCVDPECGKPAPYRGAWCDSCQSRWEDEQREKASGRGEPSTCSEDSDPRSYLAEPGLPPRLARAVEL